MFALIETLLLLVTCLFVAYKYITRKNDYFKKRNIPYIKPYPWFGNFPGAFLGTESLFDGLVRIHTLFKDRKVYGMFDFSGPVIVLRDPELIKQITIKDADHFLNHRTFVTEEDDAMIGNMAFMMQNEKWKDMRSTLTPAFTGTKMRFMFDLIQECCDEAVKYMRSKIENSTTGSDIDMKDFFTRFTNDVIATCAFGIRVNSLAERNNEFYRMGKKINTFGFKSSIKFFLINNFRPITRAIGLNLFDKHHMDYFQSLVIDSMKYREEHKIYRPDMINLLMESRKAADRKRDWTDIEIVAQCFGFFMAGFETTGTTMCFCAHELMENQDIQEQLRAEVDEVKESLNGKPISYEVLQSMKYLDMVVSETFRKWPMVPFVDRVCNKDYELKVDEDEIIQLKPGDACCLNIYALHRSEENFPEPEVFDPERFNEDNKINIKPYSFIPFGSGPRNCIGNRFALMEIKAILYYILSEFSFEVSEKATIPIEINKKGLQMQPKNGFWVKLCPR